MGGFVIRALKKWIMGKRYTHLYMQSVLDGKPPRLWAAPPGNIVASDLVETMMNSIVAFGGVWLVTGGIQIITAGRLDSSVCLAWGGIAAGGVMLAPIAGDVLADLLSDIRQGWERGAVVESEPGPPAQMIAPVIQSETDISRTEGEWWYKTEQGRLCKYNTPVIQTGRNRGKPIISYIKMRSIFSHVLAGIPFSSREVRKKMNGSLSDPQFRILQKDFRHRKLYLMQGDRSGQFTRTGKQVVSAIANYPPAPAKKAG